MLKILTIKKAILHLNIFENRDKNKHNMKITLTYIILTKSKKEN